MEKGDVTFRTDCPSYEEWDAGQKGKEIGTALLRTLMKETGIALHKSWKEERFCVLGYWTDNVCLVTFFTVWAGHMHLLHMPSPNSKFSRGKDDFACGAGSFRYWSGSV